MGVKVPEILMSGHHAKIEDWRRKKSIERTFQLRPDLLNGARLTPEEKKYLQSIRRRRDVE